MFYLQICGCSVPIEKRPLGTGRKKQSQKQKRKSEISQKVAKQVGEIITFARFSCTGEHFGHKKIFDLIPVLTSPPLSPSVTVIGSERLKKSADFAFF